jgi:macrolide phosphotransferase
MTNPLNTSDLERLAAIVEARFPDLRPARPLAIVGRGFRSIAVETPGGVVLRVGQSPDAADDYAREWRIGAFLSTQLGGIVPEPRWYAEPCDDFPQGALGYKKLPGETPEWDSDPGAAFARDLGAFMARLHRLPIDEARSAGVPDVDSYKRILGARRVVLPLLKTRLDSETFARIEAWWSSFATDDRMRTMRRTVCHHDLWHDNLLRSPDGHLSGVLDIAHVEISDPAHDFAAPRYFGDAFMAELVDAYRDAGGRLDQKDEYRAQRYFEAREFGGLAWAIEHNDEPETDSAIEKILRGPILVQSI